MEAELINAFVEKQREIINDTMARTIMLEARLIVADRKLQQVAELQKTLHDYELKNSALDEQNKAMNQLIENQKQDIVKLQQKERELQQTVRVNVEQKEKIDQLQKQINKLTLEKEAQRQKAEKMKKKAEEMMSDNG
jgi:predicted RNase H-like nuclease (RuvC/YqgF family)